jgi:hypothetical protein
VTAKYFGTKFSPTAVFGFATFATQHRIDATVQRQRTGLLSLPASSAWTERRDWEAAVRRAAEANR